MKIEQEAGGGGLVIYREKHADYKSELPGLIMGTLKQHISSDTDRKWLRFCHKE